MTRDKIIRMALEACDVDKVGAWSNGFWTITQEELERFAALVATAEREACAKVCDEIGGRDSDSHAWDAAAAIRARGGDVFDA
jgi:hypothetical protein